LANGLLHSGDATFTFLWFPPAMRHRCRLNATSFDTIRSVTSSIFVTSSWQLSGSFLQDCGRAWTETLSLAWSQNGNEGAVRSGDRGGHPIDPRRPLQFWMMWHQGNMWPCSDGVAERCHVGRGCLISQCLAAAAVTKGPVPSFTDTRFKSVFLVEEEWFINRAPVNKIGPQLWSSFMSL
jgi:hypothetical protein